jgi:predicted homoserine dehydrogenase-like protein
MGAANLSQIVLGATSLEITREPIANNPTELIPYTHIVGVVPVLINSKSQYTAEDQAQGNWKYRFDDMVKVDIKIADGTNFMFELQEITNQAGWTANLAGQQQCVADINALIP